VRAQISPSIEVVIYGEARPAGALAIGQRKDGGRFLHHRSGPELAAWKNAIRSEVGPLVTDPTRAAVRVAATFCVKRPAGHFGTGRNAGTLKASAPAFPTTRAKGDVDKLARALLDALTGVYFADDSQVVDLRVRKLFADSGPVRLELRLSELDEVDALFERGAPPSARPHMRRERVLP